MGLHTCTAVARSLCVSWAFLFNFCRVLIALLGAVFDIVQLEKISISRKDRKEKYRSDGSSTRCRNIEDLARDEEQMLKFQQTISRLSDSDVNARFEQMLVSTIL